jgi:hypothetical protein
VTEPDGRSVGEEPPEADVVDAWREAPRVTTARDKDANEADLIEQAIAVPDDDLEFDR